MMSEQQYYSREGVMTGNRLFGRTLVFSVVCHIVLLGVIIVSPEFSSRKVSLPNAIRINLVTLPEPQAPVATAPPAIAGPEKTAPASEIAPEKRTPASEITPEKRSAAKQGKKVNLTKTSLPVKTSVKHKTYNAEKVVRTAIEQIKKDLPQSGSKKVNAAIDRLKEQVAQHEQIVQGARGAAGSLQLMDVYHAEIWHRIQRKWAFSDQLARGREDLEAVMIVRIMKDGRIEEIWPEQSSGNRSFDDSVFRAIKKSDPLPPLPEGYQDRYYEVGIRFNLSELQKNGKHGGQ